MSATFEDLATIPGLCNSVKAMGWERPTEVQTEAIPLILGGGDVVVISETGSGKTGAVCLPILQVAYEQRLKEALLITKSPPKFLMSSLANCSVDDQENSVTGTDANVWVGAKANYPMVCGNNYYFQAEIRKGDLVRVGVATKAANPVLGIDAFGLGFGSTAKKSHKGSFVDFGDRFGSGDTVGCLVSIASTKISVEFDVNGKKLGVAFAFADLPEWGEFGKIVLYPAVSVKNATVILNCTPVPETHAEGVDLTLLQVGGANMAKLPIVLVLEPSIELCKQIAEQLNAFQKCCNFELSTQLLTGGQSVKRQIHQLQQHAPDIVVGTPSRIIDLEKCGALDVSGVQFLFIDEADAVAELCRLKDLTGLKEKMLSSSAIKRIAPRLQILLSSATLSSMNVRTLIAAITKDPMWVDLKAARLGLSVSVPSTIKHFIIPVTGSVSSAATFEDFTDGIYALQESEKLELARSTQNARKAPELEVSNNIKTNKLNALLQVLVKLDIKRALIFVRTHVDASNLNRFLQQRFEALAVSVLSRGKSPGSQPSSLAQFQSGAISFLIATDVAARGIDISELPCVINMTLPSDPETYIHRIGRVGRAGVPGLALSFAATEQKEQVWFHTCKKPATCVNTELKSKGGCTIWYDEAFCLKQIEALLDAPIQQVSLDQIVSGKYTKQRFLAQQAPNSCTSDKATQKSRSMNQSFQSILRQLTYMENELQRQYLSYSAI